MITSRTFSTCVWVAASISSTSMSRPSAISRQASQRPQGSGIGPCSQLSAASQDAGGRGFSDAARPGKHERLREVAGRDGVAQCLGDAALADDLVKPTWAPLAGENLVSHAVVSPDSTVVSRESRGGSDRGPEGPAAHVSDYLALLPSGPDAVHRLRLHRVRARGATRHGTCRSIRHSPQIARRSALSLSSTPWAIKWAGSTLMATRRSRCVMFVTTIRSGTRVLPGRSKQQYP